ncbi:MAG: hypothetical protein ACKVP0_20790 [Pirellulaceae bacterium]
MIERIAASSGGTDVLTRIYRLLSVRQREILWGYLLQTDTHELAFAMGVEVQTAHNELAIILQKLAIDSRTELLRQVFSALLERLKKS